MNSISEKPGKATSLSYGQLWKTVPFPMAVIRRYRDDEPGGIELVDANAAFGRITGLSRRHHTKESLYLLFREWHPEISRRLAGESFFDHLPAPWIISTGKGKTLRRYMVSFSSLDNDLVLVAFSPQYPAEMKRAPVAPGETGGEPCVMGDTAWDGLIESEKREETLQGIFDAISSGILLMDREGEIILFNRWVTRLFGYTADELAGMNYLGLVVAGERQEALQRVRRLICSERMTGSGERRYLQADGAEFHGMVTARRLLHPDGSFWALLMVITDISEEKIIRAALHRSEYRLQTLFNTIPDMVVFKDRWGLFLRCNKSFEQFWGEKESDLIGKTVFDLLDPELAATVEKSDHQVIEGRKMMVGEETLVAKRTGNRGTFEAIKTPVYDSYGHLIGVLVVARDITRRIKDQGALRDNEARYRELFENMDSGVVVLSVGEGGRHFKIREFNRGAEQITGRKRETILGRMAVTVFSEFLHTDIAEAVIKVWKTGKPCHLPVNIYEDGVLRLWLSVNVYRLPSREVVIVSNDITAKKRIEEQLKVQHDILTSVVNSMGDCLLIINREFKVEFQNEASTRFRGNLIGQTCYPGPSPCSHCRMDAALEQGCMTHVEIETPEKKHLELTFSPLQGGGTRDKVVVLIRDVTERKKLQAETMRAGHLASIGELAAGVAHEINNPVTGIISIAEILSDEFQAMGGDRRIPERIINEGERISKIVKNLLSFARVQHEGRHPVSLACVIDETLNLVERWLCKDGIRLSLNLAPDIPMILANEQEMQQVFLNLFSNARHALNQKDAAEGGEKKIWVIARRREAQGKLGVRVSVVDNGTGIPDSIIQSITDPFFTTKPQGEGTGLGLSISHGIIKNHKGSMHFESVEGAFTRVILTLPTTEETPGAQRPSRGKQ